MLKILPTFKHLKCKHYNNLCKLFWHTIYRNYNLFKIITKINLEQLKVVLGKIVTVVTEINNKKKKLGVSIFQINYHTIVSPFNTIIKCFYFIRGIFSSLFIHVRPLIRITTCKKRKK